MGAATPSGLLEAAVYPFSLRVDELACMLNFELADHPVYDGGELQWFDDDVHGTGMLAFLSRRDGRRVDYYVQPGLRVDRGGYEIGGGTGRWTEVDFDVARLTVREDGVDAEVRFSTTGDVIAFLAVTTATLTVIAATRGLLRFSAASSPERQPAPSA